MLVVELATRTLIALVVAVLPAVSAARAAIVWVPFVAKREFQLNVYGAVPDEPTTAPSTRKSTWSTARLSEALAVSGTLPETVALALGAVSETVGGVVSPEPVGAASSIPRSSTVSEPLEDSVRPKFSPLVPPGMTGVVHVACFHVEDAAKFGLVFQNANAPRVSRLNAVKATGAVDLYHAVTLYR